MKIVEQYLRAIETKLPWKSRKDIIEELRSLLMDQIEASYGKKPDEDEVKTAIAEFGSPGMVAARYRGERPVIAPGLTDLYFLIAVIMAGAMLIAFTTIFAIEYLQNLPTGMDLIRKIFMIPVNAIGGWFNGIGFLTVTFIVLSRLRHFSVNLEEDWSVDKLKDIPLAEKTESRAEAFISIGFLTILIVVMNLYPGIVTLCENTFARSGLPLGHRVEVGVFRKYVGILTILWIVGIITRVLTLGSGGKGTRLKWVEIAMSAAEALMAGIMLSDRNLYSESSGWVGIKVIFFIILVVNLAEIFGSLFRIFRDRIIESPSRN